MTRIGGPLVVVLAALALPVLTEAARVGLTPLQAASSRPGDSRPEAGTGADGGPTRYEYDVGRVRSGLDRPDHLRRAFAAPPRPMFRVDIEGDLPSLESWLGDIRALQVGPVSTPYYHAEFLRQVTPQDLSASWTNGEVAQLLVTGLAGGLALRGLANALKAAAASRGRGAACKEVAASVVGLNGERVKAGLVPVPVPEC